MGAVQQQLGTIPDKSYFRIGEVARMTDLEPYVLRYWETEFKDMAPPKSRSNQRMYRRKEVEKILLIKRLLYQEGFTIAGARRRLGELSREDRQEARGSGSPAANAALARIRSELVKLRERLARV